MAAAGMGSVRREAEAAVDVGADDHDGLIRQAGLLGIITCSMAIALAMSEPPPGLDRNAYFLTLAGAFFAAIAGVVATVCVSDNNPRAHRAAGRKLMHTAIGALAVVAGVSAASLLYR